MDPLRPATRPTMHFIGVTTGRSSILRVFPSWAAALGLGDCELRGIDLKLRAPPEAYRAAVAFIKHDPLSVGALVTAHKLDVFTHAADLLDGCDRRATDLHEISCLSKRDGQLRGHALDPLSSALALDALVPEGHWRRSGAAAFLIGAGGTALAISCCLADAARSGDRPSRLVVSDIDAVRLDHLAQVHARLGVALPVDYALAATPADNAGLMAALPPGSLVVNATGLGKDAPGSPLPDSATFPVRAIAWDLNYRGDLHFLAQARAQQAARDLQVSDGWVYFLHGWTRAIAEVFHRDVPTHGPILERLSQLAGEARG